jgi:predicted aspartyl protease
MAYRAAPAANGALIIPVTLFSEDRKQAWKGTALLDTGAQYALIHPSLVKELGLKSRAEREINTQVGVVKTRTYILPVVVEGLFDDLLSAQEFLGEVHGFVLGRQFLAKMSLSVNWPEATFELERAKFV